MEGAGGKSAIAAEGVGRSPDCRALAKAESLQRSTQSAKSGQVNPRSKNKVFGEGEKVCSRGLEKFFFTSTDTRLASFQRMIALF